MFPFPQSDRGVVENSSDWPDFIAVKTAGAFLSDPIYTPYTLGAVALREVTLHFPLTLDDS